MSPRAVIAASLTALALATAAAPAASAKQADPNPWLTQRVLNMAHSGGETEAPTNTLYAFKRAVALGSDMIELDVQSTKDKKVVVLHNSTLDETTNGKGKVVKQSWRQVKKADAGYWFVPGQGTTHDAEDKAYKLRGARDGERRVQGYARADFRVPLLKEVLKAFPKVPINIEIKGTDDDDAASFLRTGRLLSAMLNKSGRTDVIVTSFDDAALVDFHARSPQIGLAPGRDALTAYFLGGARPMEGTVALQVPVTFGGLQVMSKEFVAKAHADGYAVHVWFSGSAPDNAKTYNAMLDMCADGLMPARPTLFERILDKRDIERPGKSGTHPCRLMADQVWEGTVEGRLHRVESRGDVVRTHVWTVDGEQVAEKKTMDDKATLKAGTAAYDGSLMVRFSALGRPRRATLLPREGLGELGIGGTDLAPEPGSAAARYEEKVLAHPTRHTIVATLGGVATVVLPILLVALLARFAVDIPWPDIDIPFPDLPSIPWPNLPSIPWPDISLPDVSLPGWLAWLLDNVHFVWPVVLAFVLARAEVTRRRKHAEQLEAQRSQATDPKDDEGRTADS